MPCMAFQAETLLHFSEQCSNSLVSACGRLHCKELVDCCIWGKQGAIYSGPAAALQLLCTWTALLGSTAP